MSHWVAGHTVSLGDPVGGWGYVLPMGYLRDASALESVMRTVLKSFCIIWSKTAWLRIVFL